MSARPQNWVFLGDSLTEGIGSSRVTYVGELAARLRASGRGDRAVHHIRLRDVDPRTFNPYIPTNLAGFLDADRVTTADALWIWNLASEGKTIESDVQWLPLLRNLAPQRIFIYRGSLESIIRPAAVRDGQWPAWVPGSWRGFVSMDPRCYFSTKWYRYAKQAGIDTLKQRARLRLLAERPGRPYFDPENILAHYATLLQSLSGLPAAVHVLGLIGPDENCFPGSPAHFSALNERVRALAAAHRAEFIDWAQNVLARRDSAPWRYRDGFHPNLAGAQLLAGVLYDRFSEAPR